MREKPILFSAPMVLAILAGRKTQTRRIAGHTAIDHSAGAADIEMDEKTFGLPNHEFFQWAHGEPGPSFFCPYGQPGDRLWVRETWQGFRQVCVESDEWEEMESPKDRHHAPYQPVFKADGENFPAKWFPSIHMPRAFSRILLEITGVRVERLQAISERDAMGEGITAETIEIEQGDYPHDEIGFCADPKNEDEIYRETAKKAFECLWEAINGAGSWAENPWVWVVEFKRVKPA